MSTDVQHTYVTKGGLTIRLKSVSGRLIALAQSAVEAEFREAHRPIDPPSFTAVVFGGEEAEFPLTEDLLDAPGDEKETQRRKAAWAAHKQALEDLEDEHGKVQTSALLGLGCKFDMPSDDAWIAEVMWATNGKPIPENPIDRRVFFLLNYAMDEVEIQMLLSQLQMLSAGMNPSEQDVASFRGGILSKMERATRKAIAGVVATDDKQVDSKPDVPGSTGDAGVAHDADAVGRDAQGG